MNDILRAMQVTTEKKKKITFSCPKCSATLKVPAQLAGVSGPCPKCGGTIVAPKPDTNPVDKPAQERPRPASIAPAQRPAEATTAAAMTRAPMVRPSLPPVQIEDLNDSSSNRSVAPEKPASPQPFPESLENSDSQQKQPKTAPADEKQNSGNAGGLAPLPISRAPETPSTNPAPDEAPQAPAPVSRPVIDEQGPTIIDDSGVAPESTSPQVTVSTIPTANSKPKSDDLPPPKQVVSETILEKPSAPPQRAPQSEQKADVTKTGLQTTPGVSRIRRDVRREAIAAANSKTAADSSETKPISPVTKPAFLETDTPKQDSAAISTPQVPAAPRLDVSLAQQTPVQSEAGHTTAQVSELPKKPTGPTRINLPQLNPGGNKGSQPVAGPPQASPPSEQNPIAAAVAKQPEPVPTPKAQPNEQAPQPAQPRQPAEQSSVEPSAQEQPQTQQQPQNDPSTVPPVVTLPARRAEEGATRESTTSSATENPATGSEQGLGNLILNESQPSGIPQTPEPQQSAPIQESSKLEAELRKDSSEFDQLFGPAPQTKEGKTKRLSLIAAVAIGVIALTGVAVYWMGQAFGGFNLDEKETGGTPSTVAAPPEVEDPPAVPRPVEKPAIAKSEVDAGTQIQPNPLSKPAEAEPDTSDDIGSSAGDSSLVLSDGGSSTSVVEIAGGSGVDPKTDTSNQVGGGEPIVLPKLDTDPTIVTGGNDDISNQIRQNIEDAARSITGEISSSVDAGTVDSEDVVNTFKSVVDAVAGPPGPTTGSPAAAINNPTLEPNPDPVSPVTSAGGPTGEFKTTTDSTTSAPAVETPSVTPKEFKAPKDSTKIGACRDLVETFLKAPTWKDQLPYVYQRDQIEPFMQTYYQRWPYESMPLAALKFDQMESDPKYGGPFWIYIVSSSDQKDGFPIIVRQEGENLKIDWGVQAEFRDELFAKFRNGEIAGRQQFRVVVEHQTGYYGADSEVFANLKDYFIFKVSPPYGGQEHAETAFVPKNSPAGQKLNELVPLYSQPLAVIIELENQAFPHGINHLVITKFLTDGWSN